jgi:pilus assembly protein Flp/PilA
MLKQISRFVADDTGANALEYALIMSLVAVAVIAGVTSVGTNLGTFFTNMGTVVKGLKT